MAVTREEPMARRRTAVSKGARLKQVEEPRATHREAAGERVPAFRNRRGQQVEPRAFFARGSQNQFGQDLETGLSDVLVGITQHDAVQARVRFPDDLVALIAA